MNASSRTELKPSWPELGIAPSVVLRAFGMRRAGNHAVINWLLRNAPSGNTVFLNNCVAGRNPFNSFKTVEINGSRCVPKGPKQSLADFTGEAGDGATLLMSYEDLMPPVGDQGRPVSADLDVSFVDRDILIYRGFLNWSASLVKKLGNNPGYKQAHRASIVLRAIEMYSNALEMISNQNSLGLVAICYDDWLDSAEYRASILEQLGFAQKDDSLGKVQSYGGGSSFQPDAGQVDALATERRWKQMAADPIFQIILWLSAQDDALLDRLDAVFPEDADRLRRFGKTAIFSNALDTGETR